jgi:predicted Zn-dependent protease
LRILLRLAVLTLVALAVAAPRLAAATLIRDAEIEQTLARIAHPIFRAAGLNPATVNIYIVDDRDMNAFVAGGQNLFLHTGLLARLETIDQLRVVIAHEAAHIAGGHLARRDQALRGARGVAVLGLIGAAAATVGGSPEAGLAIATGTGQAAMRSALAHTRAEESSADQAGLRYLAAAGGDPAAVLEVLRLFRGQEALIGIGIDPYAVTHPLWSERIALIEERVAAMPRPPAPDPADAYWHARMVAKIDGFLQSPGQVLKRYPEDGGETAELARAVAWHRRPDPARALAGVDTLLAARPDDPFYNELKGQFLLEAGQAAPAVEAYRRAVELAPKEPLILGGLGRALLNTGDGSATAEARDALARSAELDGANSGVLRDLALAEARLGNDGAAALATAERFLVEGAFPDALRNAERAAALLPEGSPGWRQAQDVITMTRRTLNRGPG